MSRFTLKALCAVGAALTLFGLSACNPDECQVNGDCDSEEICSGANECIPRIDLEEDLCRGDEDCEGEGEICNAGICAEGCRGNADCEAGREFCDLNELECAIIPDECQNSLDCPANFICQPSQDGGPQQCVPECSENAQCEQGLSCVDGVCTGCLNNADCAEGEICRVGRCTPPRVQCEGLGLNCDPALPVRRGFTCAKFPGDGDYACYESCRDEQTCTASALPNGDGTYSDENGFISIEATNCAMGSLCESDLDGTEACRRSECEDPVLGQLTCDAIAAADPQRFPNGANCMPRSVQNLAEVSRGGTFNVDLGEDTAFFCAPAGRLQRFATGCLRPASGLGQAPPRCAQGLTCIEKLGFIYDLIEDPRGSCEIPCTNDAQCDQEAGDRCLGLDSKGDFNNVGICRPGCDPYSTDPEICPSGTTCSPVSSEDGVCHTIFGPAGTDEAYGVCTQGGCPNNTVCLNFTGTGARCVPQCDPTRRNQDDANNTCIGGDPRGHVKFLHLAPNAPDVDVYVDGRRTINDLVFGETGDQDGKWFDLSVGRHTIEVVLGSQGPNGTKLISTTVTLASNSSQYVAIVPDGVDGPVTAAVIAEERVARNAAGSTEPATLIRAAHAVNGVGAVDIVAVTANANVSNTAGQRVLAQGITFGQTGAYTALPAGSYDVYVFPAGASRDAANAAVVFEDVVVANGDKGTVFAYGSTRGPSPMAPGVTFIEHRQFGFIPQEQGYCYDLEQGVRGATSPSTGFCLQRCGSYLDYGTEICGPGGKCSVFGDDTSVCFGVNGGLGDPCLDTDDCSSDLTCESTGTDIGVCRLSPCDTNAADAALDDCPLGFVCDETGGGGGVCRAAPSCASDSECERGFYCDDDNGSEPGICRSYCTEDEECLSGFFCDETGNEEGICRSYCTVEGFSENSNLQGCQDNEQCFASDLVAGLGECRIPCTPVAPGDFRDPSCPANQQNCYPHDNYNFYCSASGATAQGDSCATVQGVRVSNDFSCEPGSLCTRDIATPDSTFEVTLESFVNKTPNESATCRAICRPFLSAGQSDCGEGLACTPILPTQDVNVFAGVCTKKVSQVGIGNDPEACPPGEVGRMCDDGSFCNLGQTLLLEDSNICQASASCFELCNPASGLGCSPGKTCGQQGSTDLPSYFIGEFGFCNDI